MASTADGTTLTEGHRRQQLALSAATIRDVLTIWRAFALGDIVGTWPQVETALVALIQARWAVSAGLAARYYDQFRAAEGVTVPAVARLAPVPASAKIVGPLIVIGPRVAGRLWSLNRPDAAAVTLTNVAGEVSRQVLNGGRTTILDSVSADPKGLAYLRVTAASPCAYCALLASRGPVYISKKSALMGSRGAKYHRSCGCTAEPVFDREAAWPGKGREYADVWSQAKAKAKSSGDSPEVEFRRLIEGR